MGIRGGYNLSGWSIFWVMGFVLLVVLIGMTGSCAKVPETPVAQNEPAAPWDNQPKVENTETASSVIINGPEGNQPKEESTPTPPDNHNCHVPPWNEAHYDSTGNGYDPGCNTKTFEAQEIFDLDRCRVYRFTDAGAFHYYQDCVH